MNIPTVKGIITFMMFESIQNSTCYRSSQVLITETNKSIYNVVVNNPYDGFSTMDSYNINLPTLKEAKEISCVRKAHDITYMYNTQNLLWIHN